MSELYYESQYFTTTLSVAGGIDDSQTDSIVLQSVTGIHDTSKPGIALFSYADPLDTSVAEWLTFTSINSTTKTLVGVTRGAEGFSAKAHGNGVTIAFPHSKSHINRINDKLTGVDPIVSATLTSPTITGDVGLATGANIQVNSADPYRTIDLTPGFLKPTTTAGCADSAKVEAGTNDIDYDVLDFDKDTDEHAFVNFHMPDSWDAGVIQFRYIWTCAAGIGGTGKTVNFAVKGLSLSNDDAIDAAQGTAVAVADTWIADGDIHISAWSGDVTLANTPAAGDLVHLDLMRDISEDDLAGDARIIQLQVRYKQAQYSD